MDARRPRAPRGLRRSASCAALAICLFATRASADETDAASPSERRVYIHIDSSEPASLYRLRGSEHERLCEAPCDRHVPARRADRFEIRGAFPSPGQFQLPTEDGRAFDIEVRPGSGRVSDVVIGAAMALVGTAATIYGLVSGAIVLFQVDHDIDPSPVDVGLAIGGLVAGPALGIGGYFLAVGYGSDVRITPRDTAGLSWTYRF